MMITTAALHVNVQSVRQLNSDDNDTCLTCPRKRLRSSCHRKGFTPLFEAWARAIMCNALIHITLLHNRIRQIHTAQIRNHATLHWNTVHCITLYFTRKHVTVQNYKHCTNMYSLLQIHCTLILCTRRIHCTAVKLGKQERRRWWKKLANCQQTRNLLFIRRRSCKFADMSLPTFSLLIFSTSIFSFRKRSWNCLVLKTTAH